MAVLVIAGIVWGQMALVDDSAGPETGVTLEQIVDEPRQYLGQQVTVSGELEERYERAFVVRGDALGEELLILPRSGVSVLDDPQANDVLQVTGTATLVGEEYEATLDDQFDTFDGKLAILATSVGRDAR